MHLKILQNEGGWPPGGASVSQTHNTEAERDTQGFTHGLTS